MKSVACIVAAILAFASAFPMENAPAETSVAIRNSVLEQLFLGIVEDFRQTMLTGSDALPVMDPFNLEHLHLELTELGLEGGHVTLGNVEANQLSTFVVDNLEIVMTSVLLQRYSIDIDMHIPVIEADSGSYDLSVTAMGVHVFGAGSMKVKIIEPRIKASFEAGISLIGGIGVTLRSAHVVFQLTGFEPEITGMFNNDLINDFLNAFLKSLIPDMVAHFEDEITVFLSDLVMEVGNDLIGGILGSSSVTARDAAVVMMLPVLQAEPGFEHVLDN